MSIAAPASDSRVLQWGELREGIRLAIANSVAKVEVTDTFLDHSGDESFDLIIADSAGLNAAVVRRWLRLLKPNGVAAINLQNIFSPKALLGVLGGSRSWHGCSSLGRAINLLQRQGLSVESYWPYPSFDRCYNLIPASEPWVSKFMDEFRQSPGSAPSWTHIGRSVSRKMGLQGVWVPEFFVLARKSAEGPLHQQMVSLLGSSPTDGARFWLSSYENSNKSVIRFYQDDANLPSAFVKASVAPRGIESELALQAEFHSLSLISRKATTREAPFKVPRPLGEFHIGRAYYTVESPARGEQLAHLLARCSTEQRQVLLEEKLELCLEAAISVARLLKDEASLPLVPQEWWSPGNIQGLSLPHLESNGYNGWGQQGDLTVENILLDETTKELWIIDWEHTLRGVPPLFDLLSLIISCLYVMDEYPRVEERFREAFFSQDRWGRITASLLERASASLSVDKNQAWRMFIEFLVLRTSYARTRNSPLADQYVAFLRHALANQQAFILSS